MWQGRIHDCIFPTLNALFAEVSSLFHSTSTSILEHPRVMLFLSITDAMREILKESSHEQHSVQKALGASYAHYCSVRTKDAVHFEGKFYKMALFFRPLPKRQCIVFLWFCDEVLLRAHGHCDDVYKAFQQLVTNRHFASEEVPLLRQTQRIERFFASPSAPPPVQSAKILRFRQPKHRD